MSAKRKEKNYIEKKFETKITLHSESGRILFLVESTNNKKN